MQQYRDAAQAEIAILRRLNEGDARGTKYVFAVARLQHGAAAHSPAPPFSSSHGANRSCCIQLLNTFDFRNHICMVFPLYDMSIFDFLRDNLFYPFPLDQVRTIGNQLLRAIACTLPGGRADGRIALGNPG